MSSFNLWLGLPIFSSESSETSTEINFLAKISSIYCWMNIFLRAFCWRIEWRQHQCFVEYFITILYLNSFQAEELSRYMNAHFSFWFLLTFVFILFLLLDLSFALFFNIYFLFRTILHTSIPLCSILFHLYFLYVVQASGACEFVIYLFFRFVYEIWKLLEINMNTII